MCGKAAVMFSLHMPGLVFSSCGLGLAFAEIPVASVDDSVLWAGQDSLPLFFLQTLLGVLRVSSSNGSLVLEDRSQSLPCIIFHKDGRPFAHTSLIGMFQINYVVVLL